MTTTNSTIASEYSLNNLERAISIEEFNKLLRDPATEIWMLQSYAYRLLEKGVAATDINYESHGYFEVARNRRLQTEIDRAKEIALAFSDRPFQWHYLMNLDAQEQTIKGPGEE